MSFSSETLYGYYDKCGVPEYEARLVSSLFGENYTVLQAQERSKGQGTKSKAYAAGHISNCIFLGACLHSDFYLWDTVYETEQARDIVNIVSSAGICSIGVYAYALDENPCASYVEMYGDFLNIAKLKLSTLGDNSLNTINELGKFQVKAVRLSIEATALGKRKGFFSKMFG
ncbi:MAG: hypothetical protein ABGY11_09225 [Candidatus Thioglobus sp.]